MEIAAFGATPRLDEQVTGPTNTDHDVPRAEILAAYDVLKSAFECRDIEMIEALTTEDHQAVTPFFAGALTWDEQRVFVEDCDVTQRPVGEISLARLAPNIVLQTHVAELSGTVHGQAVAPLVAVSIIWQRVHGGWLERFYQETAIDRPH